MESFLAFSRKCISAAAGVIPLHRADGRQSTGRDNFSTDPGRKHNANKIQRRKIQFHGMKASRTLDSMRMLSTKYLKYIYFESRCFLKRALTPLLSLPHCLKLSSKQALQITHKSLSCRQKCRAQTKDNLLSFLVDVWRHSDLQRRFITCPWLLIFTVYFLNSL